MIERTVEIMNPEGLHARMAALFVQTAGKYTSLVWVKKDDKTVNAKSIMGIMAMSISGGEMVTIIADGEDEEKAIEELILLINDKIEKF